MVNAELIDLCRTVVAAIQDTDSFEAPQLRRLLLHIVPQLLTEIDILCGVVEMYRLAQEEASVQPVRVVDEEVSAAPPALPATKRQKKAEAKLARKKKRRK